MLLVILMCCISFGCGKQSIQPCINEETLGEINTKIDALITKTAKLQKNERIWITELPSWIVLFKFMALESTHYVVWGVFCIPLLDKLRDVASSLLIRIGCIEGGAEKEK